MDIKHLRYFVAMAEAGSLMKASERLHVAQPALSVHLSNLELELGVVLFERSNRGIILTEQGEMLYERATNLLKYHSEAILSMKQGKASLSGSLTLGVPSTVPGVFAPHLYRALREALPEVSVYMLDASSAAVYEWLKNGKIDLAVVFNIPDDPMLSLSPLFIEDFWLAGQFEGEAEAVEIPFEKVFDYPLVLPGRSSSWRKILDETAESHGKSLSVMFETESYTALRALAMSGECYTILPRLGIMQDHLDGLFQARRIIEPEMHGVLSMANLNSAELTHAQKAARDVIVTTMRTVAAELGLGTGAATIPKVYPDSPFEKHRKFLNARRR